MDVVPQRRGLRLRESLRPPVFFVAGVAGGRGAEFFPEVPVEVHPVGVHHDAIGIIRMTIIQDPLVTLGAAVPPSVLPPIPVLGATVLVAVRIQNWD